MPVRAEVPMIPRMPIVVAGVLLFLVVPSFAGFYTDWIWFKQVGFDQLFIRTLSSKLILGGAVFAIAFSVLLGGLRYALRDMTKPYLTLGGGPEVQPLVIDRKGLQLIAAGVSGLAALFWEFLHPVNGWFGFSISTPRLSVR